MFFAPLAASTSVNNCYMSSPVPLNAVIICSFKSLVQRDFTLLRFKKKVFQQYGKNNDNIVIMTIIMVILISNFLEIDFAINISDKKSRRFDLSEVIFKCIKVL